MTQGKLDLSTFFFFLITASELIEEALNPDPADNWEGSCDAPRVPHGYGFTRGVSKTGPAGAGTVLNFGIPQHTAYPYHGVTGIHGY